MIHLLINPCAGKGRSAEIGKLVEQTLSDMRIPFTKSITSYAGHAPELAREAVASGCTLLLAVGGDGTLSEVAQALIGTDTVLGIIPSGRGNDYIKTLGISPQWRSALDIALFGDRDNVDAMRVNERVCLNISSVGMDASATYYTNRRKVLRGQAAYLAGLILAFFMAKLPEFAYSIDEGPTQHTGCTLAVFANGQYYGGVFRPVPVACHNDGIMDVLFVDKLSRLRIIPMIIGYAKGKHVGWDVCHFHRCRHICLHTDRAPMIFNVDGDIFTAEHVDILLMPGAIRIAVPKKGALPNAD